MDSFADYVRDLEDLVTLAAKGPLCAAQRADVSEALNGGAWRRLRETASPLELRRTGAFFTNHALAARLASTDWLGPTPTYLLDPTCGAGDLLLAAAKRLRPHPTLAETLRHWGQYIAGYDINPLFVRAAQARLVLLALSLGLPGQASASTGALKGIRVNDALVGQWSVRRHHPAVLLNPPFTATSAPVDCTWAGGSVSGAAIFLDTALRNVDPGTRLVAILPEALRTGSRYGRWRRHIETLATLHRVEALDRFDRWTDVHVFLIALDRRVEAAPVRETMLWTDLHDERCETLGDRFDVITGPVVPHRDAKLGGWYPFAHARDVTPWRVVDAVGQLGRRRYLGRVFTPPFVVVRRTSRPEDRYRTIASIITGENDVAVENHLLILMPKDRTMRSCRDAIRVLRSKPTSDWMNQRIRCRHLTVGSVSSIPWRVA